MTPTNAAICISKSDHFNFSECLHFPCRGYDDCLYYLEEDRMVKPLHIEGSQTLFQIRGDTDYTVNKNAGRNSTQQTRDVITDYVKTWFEWFDLRRNLSLLTASLMIISNSLLCMNRMPACG